VYELVDGEWEVQCQCDESGEISYGCPDYEKVVARLRAKLQEQAESFAIGKAIITLLDARRWGATFTVGRVDGGVVNIGEQNAGGASLIAVRRNGRLYKPAYYWVQLLDDLTGNLAPVIYAEGKTLHEALVSAGIIKEEETE